MRKRLVILLFTLISLIFIGLAIQFQESDSITKLCFVVNNHGNTEVINLYSTDKGKYYVFLPSYSDLDETTIRWNSNGRLYINDTIVEDDYSCNKLNLDTDYNVCVKNAFGMVVCRSTIVLKKSENIPSMFVNLIDGKIDDVDADKSVKKTGTVDLIDADMSVDFAGSFAEFHSRGNGTWGQKKKPYTIEFKNETELLGMGKGKKYVLLADALDQSHLRNKIVYDCAKYFDIPYAVNSEYIDLYVNGDYLGLYLLCEKVEVGENRVDIYDLYEDTKAINQFPLNKYNKTHYDNDGVSISGYEIPNTPNDYSGGYLLEYQYDYRTSNRDCLFKTKDGINFSVEFPSQCSVKQMNYISGVFQRIEDHFEYSDYEKYIDVDSWLYFYLINECFGNIDLGSQFFYIDKDSDKVYAGPIWDFDMSMGNESNDYHNTSKSFFTCKDNNAGKSFFKKLYNNEDFYKQIVKTYSARIRPYLTTTVKAEMNHYVSMIESSYQMDKIRWENEQVHFTTEKHGFLSESVKYLSNWIDERITFLDDAWNNNQKYYRVLFESYTPNSVTYRMYCSVEPNQPVESWPELKADGYELIGWTDFETGELVSKDNLIQDDRVYIAKWQATSESESGNDDGVAKRLFTILFSNQEYCVFVSVLILVLGFFLYDVYLWRAKRRRRNGK